MQTELIQFVKNKKGQRIGVVLAKKTQMDNGTPCVAMGWSLCNKKDEFDKDMALSIAVGRALAGSNKPLPQVIDPEYHFMADRARKYFKCEVAI